MNETIEILFENAQLEKVVELITVITSKSQLDSFQMSTDDYALDPLMANEQEIFDMLNKSADGSFYLKFSAAEINGLTFPQFDLQIYKYCDNFDLTVCLNRSHLIVITSIVHLQTWSEKINSFLKSRNYYCGLEPAIDEETRFFSGAVLGPLKGWIDEQQGSNPAPSG